MSGIEELFVWSVVAPLVLGVLILVMAALLGDTERREGDSCGR